MAVWRREGWWGRKVYMDVEPTTGWDYRRDAEWLSDQSTTWRATTLVTGRRSRGEIPTDQNRRLQRMLTPTAAIADHARP